VGYLCYDAVRLFEAIPDRHPRAGAIPDAEFLLYDAVAAFDHPRQRLLLLTTLDLTDPADAEREVDGAVARLDRLQAFLARPDPARRDEDSDAEPFAPVMQRRAYLDAVGVVKEAIAAGDVYQCVLSQRWTGRAGIDPFDVYRALRALNPSPYLYYLETGKASVLGSSPEMLVRCRGREAETRPIAGTVSRGATPQEDARLAEMLLRPQGTRST
jgi:anthranilate synthase component 1